MDIYRLNISMKPITQDPVKLMLDQVLEQEIQRAKQKYPHSVNDQHIFVTGFFMGLLLSVSKETYLVKHLLEQHLDDDPR
jgi:ADP-dependent phosphofructokinase/glucokinase